MQPMDRRVVSPLQGLENVGMLDPRAMPWAVMVQAVGLEE